MHLRAQYQDLLVPITYQDLSVGKLEKQLKDGLPPHPKEVKKIKRLIKLSKEEEQE